MRLPLLKVYRAFPAFDSLSDEECERYVRRVRANASNATVLAAPIAALGLTVAWLAGWPLAVACYPVGNYVPMPTSLEARIMLLVATTPLFAGIGALVVRDIVMYAMLRRELARSDCRKCGQSLLGVPVSRIGVDPDPAKAFIRCPECGRRYCLLDIGLTPHELVPLEQRVQSLDVGRHRGARR